MENEIRRCVVCRCLKPLDKNGRCSLCRSSLAASDGGVSYGKYQAEKPDEPAEPEEEIEMPATEESDMRFQPGHCRWCGKAFDGKYTVRRMYCSANCQAAAKYSRWFSGLDNRRKKGKTAAGGGIWTASEMF